MEGWELHYAGWHANEFNASTYVRGPAAQGDLKPSSRKGSLDAVTLLSHGFNADRVANDPFLFFQMIFPIAMSKITSIPDDNCMPFFSLMTWFTHIYAEDNKYVWAIEQNEARETYLGHYFGIDIADYMIKNAQIKFTSWRYWHAPYLPALAMGVLAAYDMYN